MASTCASGAESGGAPVEADISPADSAVASTPVYAFPTTLDQSGRILAPVYINDAGPFRFVLDTGANRSVLSPATARALGLTASETAIAVHGVTGSAILTAVHVKKLQAGEIVLSSGVLMPVLAEEVLGDAEGILGIAGLEESRIEIDFTSHSVTIRKSTGRPPPLGFLTVPVSLKHKGLLLVDARVGRIKVKAVIDTGAERTLGNNALLKALGRSSRNAEDQVVTTVFGATPDLGFGTSMIAPRVLLADVELKNLVVTFGDLHVFRIWKLDAQPALLIGMDLLGSLSALTIDYRRREIQFKP